ncbi:hypothetical protein KK083_24765 [Fulvivirgaceae bacterium PWU4]|uniref:DUF2214 family protein n=1 Tax=Chryseosolibacter histidini TaxID=2782349 RepID=A0AAP2DT85_9BACT|nr:hypothetical protein [Chryseosolibacter histidini]MBT1700124.1 hypothetical protein [Chryseosolibacter histidini]
MNQHIYSATLVVHVVGIVLMAGTAFIDLFTFRYFWKRYGEDKEQGLVVENIAFGLQRFMGVGMLLILLSGIGMMAYLHQVWGQQLWFRIKMAVLVLIIVNGLGLRRALGNKLRRILGADATTDVALQLSKVKARMTIIQYLQLLLFIVIFTLSVFKFN